MNGKFNDINTVNQNIHLLCKFNLSDKNSFEVFNESTRDITNLNVLKCTNSGVIVLEKFKYLKIITKKIFTTLMDLKEELKQKKA